MFESAGVPGFVYDDIHFELRKAFSIQGGLFLDLVEAGMFLPRPVTRITVIIIFWNLGDDI